MVALTCRKQLVLHSYALFWQCSSHCICGGKPLWCVYLLCMWRQSGQDLFQSLLLVSLPVKGLAQGGTKGRKLGTGHIVGAQPSI